MRDTPFAIADDELVLFTDLYELAMMQSYDEAGMTGEAVFSLFVRRLPPDRNFLLACGLSDLLDGLEALRFSDRALACLKSLGRFSDRFLDRLASFRFSGDVHAVAEGTPVFAGEPILEIVAPIAEAQLVETLVLNVIHLQTLLASKAARVVAAAGGRTVVDFGARRMHGLDAALRGARAFRIAGINATSNVLAGARLGIPVAGTMAHSYVEAFDSEYEALREFARCFPDTVLLVDTYDTIAGMHNVIRLAGELGDAFRVRAVRIDSGDLAALAHEARALLDAAGLGHVGIFASGGLDETAIAGMVAAGAPVDGFGVGTAMGVSQDAPALDIAYKLSAYAGEGRLKLSPGKATYPGRRQVFRAGSDGTAEGDTIGRADEDLPGRALLSPVMRAGRRLAGVPRDLDAIRTHAREEIGRLPAPLRALAPASYPVRVSERLEAYRRDVIARLTRRSHAAGVS